MGVGHDPNSVKIELENGSVINLSDASSVDLEIDSSLEGAHDAFIEPPDREIEVSFDIEVDTEVVVCTHCGKTNHLLNSMWREFMEIQDSCRLCGYEL